MNSLFFLEKLNDLELDFNAEEDRFEVFGPDGNELCAFEKLGDAQAFMLYEATAFPKFDW